MIKSFSFIIFIFILIQLVGYGQSDTLNQEDPEGKRQGYWIIWSYMNPDKGYCDSCRIEEGTYDSGRKEGTWLKYHKDTAVVRLKGTYVDNRPNGRYVKYYRNGNRMEEGTFTSGKGTIVERRYYRSGCLSQERIEEDSTNNIRMIYYHPNCIEEGTVSGGIAIRGTIGDPFEQSAENTFRYGGYRNNGDFLEYTRVDSLSPISKNNLKYDPEKGHKLNGEFFNKNGLNDISNSEGILFMSGKFKEGSLWKGTYYIYDSGGILLNILLIRKGVVYKDGVIK
ncbi:MAG: hypothetical protein GQ574_28060 [Crocinitomix sp.]|nr:hypothetical protein [Crocinitomix sp.]